MKKLSMIAATLLATSVMAEPIAVTPENFAQAEMDARILSFTETGGLNHGLQYTTPTPTDNQPVPRMNRDTIYSGIPVDTAKGFTISIPEHSDDRYVSVYLLDNEHYTIDILRGSGTTHTFTEQMDSRYIMAIPRVEVFNHTNKHDVVSAQQVLAGFEVTSGSMEEKQIPNCDWSSMLSLRAEMEQAFIGTTQYPSDWQGARGAVNEETRNIAIGTSWGLFPDSETVYINTATGGMADQCYTATFDVPKNDGFWSVTAYDAEGYMFSDERSNIGKHTVEFNQDGTFTLLFGSLEQCGSDVNRLDTTEGWSMLMRVYLPDTSVIDGEYVLPTLEAL